MDTSPYDFLRLYPWIETDARDGGTLFEAFPGKTLEEALAADREMRLAVSEDPKFGHQKLVELYLSEHTPYRELLLFHAPGTGKTCTAIRVAERAMETGLARGCLILARGSALLKNFLHELVFSCETGGKYVPEGYADMSDQEKSRKLKKSVAGKYQFKTFETFAKSVNVMSVEAIRNRYDKFVVIMDEVHHLRSVQVEGVNTYSALLRFMNSVRGCVKILMTGTPMSNAPGELADVVNLILPKNKTISQSDGIFAPNGDLLNPVELAERLRGRVSFLKADSPEVGLAFAGSAMPEYGVTDLTLVRLEMSPYQSAAYKKAWERDQGDRNIFSNARQCSLAVLPNGTWGQEAELRTKTQLDAMASDLRRFSAKYDYVLKLAATSAKTFVYCEYVNGSGLKLLVDLLQVKGWKRATGTETNKAKRFAVLTASQRNLYGIVQRFNQEDNVDGDYISLILGSRVVAEGLTFKEVRHSVILTPHWNYTETAQAIARSWRAGSHDRLRARGDGTGLVVHRLAAVPAGSGADPSIDVEMYRVSELKDKKIKSVERVLMRVAQDCFLLKERNTYPQSFDGSRECEYGSCSFTCANVSAEPPPLVFGAKGSAETAVAEMRLNGGGDPSAMSADMASLWAETAAGKRYVNRWGDGAVLRAEKGRLELAAPYGAAEEGRWGDFYKTRRMEYAKLTPSQIEADELSYKVPAEAVELLTSVPLDQLGSTASSMPQQVQTVILMGCVQAMAEGKRVNVERRNALLSFFKGFYAQGPSGWVVWLYARGANAKLYNQAAGEWQNADDATQKFLQTRQDVFNNTPIGYYGLYNPNLRDFCIRDVTEGKRDKEDLRKLTVGRRCVDWDQKTLVHIVVRLMKINGRADFMQGLDLDTLRKLVAQDPLHQERDLRTAETCKRFLFWTQRGDNKFRRQDICKAMEKWFLEHGLMEDNFDCGHQHKRRGKFA
ncbi:NTPase [Largemouth bass virus]|uniref:NTPase n=1 Tax=Largemouth bass virus TaxID=176656 RepID=A0A9E7PRV6_9VIRU|nr:hypothetical protein [Largemouth bass virus]WAK75133.1 putative NTPase [Mandarin fish ranavirus]WEI29018.1 NTPase [Largemouth bass virus]WHA35585.1 putative NTPase [Micropterus salmoides ranavirus]WHA35690.1 putative NTPase [Siniperca chuatsi ranavirus]